MMIQAKEAMNPLQDERAAPRECPVTIWYNCYDRSWRGRRTHIVKPVDIENYRWLAGLIAAHEGRKVIGRTRLQKTVKLLQRCGFPTTYGYMIYFYGPYSEDLHAGLRLLESFGLVSEEEHLAQDGTTYHTITATEDAELPEIDEYRPLIDQLAKMDPIVLELAATYDAFRELGCDHEQALRRLRRKKGTKCGEGRDRQALELLNSIALT